MEPKTFTLRRRTTRTRFLYPASATLLLLFVFLTLRPVAIKKETASAAIDNSTYALSLTTNPEVNLQITPTANGTLSIAKDTIIANTASPAGYKLYVSTDSNSNDITIDDNTLEESQSSKFLATTGTQTSPTVLENNTWGYAIPGLASFDTSYNTTNPSNTSKFAALPALGNEALIKDHTGTATNEQTEVYYAAKADMNMTAGNYKATIMYTTVSDASSEATGETSMVPTSLEAGYVATRATITTSLTTQRDPGTVDVIIGNDPCTDVDITDYNPLTLTCTVPEISNGGQYDLLVSVPKLGKSYTKQNMLTVVADKTVTINVNNSEYGSVSSSTEQIPINATFTTSANTLTFSNGVTVTATPTELDGYITTFDSWSQASGTVTGNMTITATFSRVEKCFGLNKMQDIASLAGSMGLEEQTQLCDNRDGKIYWVAKLKDGNVWMTQNLDYDIKADSNIISNNDGTASTWTSSSTYAPQATSTDSIDASTSYDPGNYYMPNGTDSDISIASLTDSTIIGDTNAHYHLGNYYGWYAATASSLQLIGAGLDATSSICPTGWRLPTTDNSAAANYSFGNMIKNYGYNGIQHSYYSDVDDTNLLIEPLFFTRTSYDARGRGGQGYYWSSSSSNASSYNARRMFFEGRNGYSNYRIDAIGDISTSRKISVRCVATIIDSLDDIDTMQQMTTRIVTNTPENTTKQLKDERDGKYYWVTKLKDGNIWMTQNLDYDIKEGSNAASNNDGTIKNWNLNLGVSPKQTSSSIFNNSYSFGTYSYDPGNYYMPNGTGSNTPIASLTGSSIIGDMNAHYHLGNYYQWTAAVAGAENSSGIVNREMPRSICPTGWRLPTSNSYTNNYSFGKLTNSYGITDSANGASDTNLLVAPLFFTHTGYVYNGSLSDQGIYGYYWSSFAGSPDDKSYNLQLYSSKVSPSNSGKRSLGISVRCVAI